MIIKHFNSAALQIIIVVLNILAVELSYGQIPIKNHISLWLNGDSVELTSNLLVKKWYDQSGHQRNAIQSDSMKSPVLLTDSILNNKTVIGFDGNNDVLKIDSSINVGAAFVVVNWLGQQTSFPDYNGILSEVPFIFRSRIFYAEGGTSNLYCDGAFYSLFSLNETKLNSVTSKNFTPFNKYKILSGVTDSIKKFSNLIIARDADVPGREWNGNIAEIILYDTVLSITQRTQVEQYLRLKYSQQISLGNDTILSYGFCDLNINASGNNLSNYNWNTGDTTKSITINQSGKYWVSAKDYFGYITSDTINVSYSSTLTKPNLYDTICLGAQILYNTSLSKKSYTFQWQDNSTDSVYIISQAGKYYVNVTDSFGCSITSDTLTILIDSFPVNTKLGSDTTLCSGNNISLYSGASQTTNYLWNTGATTSSINIDTTGSYTLEASNSRGCIARDTIVILISGKAPLTNFSATEVCKGIITTFTDLSTVQVSTDTIKTWLWDLGSGQTSNLQNPTFLFPDSGTYYVSLLTSTNNGCSKSFNSQVRINPNPKSGFEINTSPLCSGKLINLSDTSLDYGTGNDIISWTWDMGDGANYITKSPSHTYSTSGIYLVKLITSTQKNCSDSITKNLIINTTPTPNFTASNACENQSVVFTNTSIGATSFLWNFGNLSSSILTNPTITINQIDTIPIWLTATSAAGCSQIKIDTIKVYKKPNADFSYINNCTTYSTKFKDQTNSLPDSIVSWNWTFDLNGTSNQKNPSFIFNNSGTYPVQLIVNSNKNCKDTIIKTIIISNPPQALFSFDPEYGDPPLSVNFNNLSTGAATYLWNLGNGDTSNLQQPNVVYTDTGAYSVSLIVTDNNQCTSTYNSIVNVNRNYIDIAISDIQIVIDTNNFLNISTTITNLSNRPISHLQLIAQPKGRIGEKEYLTDTIGISETLNYAFNYAPQISDINEIDYICVTGYNPNNVNDRNPSNNFLCKPIQSTIFKVSNPYPNPFEDDFTLPIITPKNATISLEIFNNIGNKVFDNVYNISSGVNYVKISSNNLPAGLYNIHVRVEGSNAVYLKKIVKFQE